MKKPDILTNGQTLSRPALEWTDGHILGNGDLGVVVWGAAGRLFFGLSKHNVYNLESPYAHGPRPEETYMRRLERFKRGDVDAFTPNLDHPDQPCDKPFFDHQTPLTMGTLSLELLPGVNLVAHTQTLYPAEGRVRVVVEPVDRRRGYGQLYPTLTVEAYVDSETNALNIRVSSGGGETVRAQWRYDWPQHMATYYKTDFTAQNAENGAFHAIIGEGNEFTVALSQRGVRPDLDASRFNLAGIVSISDDTPAEFSLRAAARGEAVPESADYDAARARTAEWWHSFWSKSMLWYSEPSLNDLWAMGLYALGASTRPDKSAPNLQGIWNLSERAIWHGDFHFNTNMQECHWVCGAANHPELAKAMMRMLIHDWRDELRLSAKEAYGVDNDALAMGVGMDWLGRDLGGWWAILSLSNTAWTAITLWDQYLFDPDEDFLRTDLYPFLQECCHLYDVLMDRDENGIYHTLLSSSPERAIFDENGRAHSLCGRDCTINVATIRGLYEAAARSAELLGDDPAPYREKAEHMPPFPQQDGVFIEMETGYFFDGPRPGVTKECHRHPSRLMPIFPAGFIGLNSDESDLELGRRSFHDFLSDGVEWITGWSFSYLANIAARLGLGAEAEQCLTAVRDEFTLAGLLSAHNRLRNNALYPDALFQIEALMAIPAAIDEMAMQSVDGIIRVFPALPDGRDCAFEHLRARGNVLVSAERKNGETRFVRLEPARDGAVTLVSPWGERAVTINGRRVLPENGRIVLNARAGDVFEVLAE